jgi:hypothetical protein
VLNSLAKEAETSNVGLIDWKKKRDTTRVLFLQIWLLLHQFAQFQRKSVRDELPRLFDDEDEMDSSKHEASSPKSLPPPADATPPTETDLAGSVADLSKKMSEMQSQMNKMMELIAHGPPTNRSQKPSRSSRKLDSTKE